MAHPLPTSGEAVDLFVLGPNGFHRRLTGRSEVFSVSVAAAAAPALRLEISPRRPQSITMMDRGYVAAPAVITLAGGKARTIRPSLKG